VNVLKPDQRLSLETLLKRGVSHREIERRTGIDRKTIRRYAASANSSGVATGSDVTEGAIAAQPSGVSVSACEPYREWIERQVGFGRNALAIYQDLVDTQGFGHGYNSVKRFVARLKQREPERYDVLEYPPGEECQVDYGLGALTLYRNGRYKRPLLFVMTLKYSGKSFRKVVWKTDQVIWAELHEEAWRSVGGSCRYVVLDNLKEGVIAPDLYEPRLNPVYAALLSHYGVVADPARVCDPNRKGTVENAIGHTQGTALKGRRFESIEAQNAFLAHWESKWASTRIHGRKKRQVMEMYEEERPYLQPLPLEGFRYFTQGTRTVDDAGLVTVESAYYAALPAAPHTQVIVRVYANDIEIFDTQGELLRRHAKAEFKGKFCMREDDRLFNPSRETVRLLARIEKIGPHSVRLAEELFSRQGRPGQRALYGLAQLPRTYPCADIEAVCQRLVDADCISYSALKKALERHAKPAPELKLTQSDPAIREIGEYQAFWEQHAPLNLQE
jgi:transposase